MVETCSWARTDHDSSWQEIWVGLCGVAPTGVTDLPTNIANVPGKLILLLLVMCLEFALNISLRETP